MANDQGNRFDDKRATGITLSGHRPHNATRYRTFLQKMMPRLNLPRALLRVRYMASAARMGHTGTPIDGGTLETLRTSRGDIQDRLVGRVEADYGVYEGRTFQLDRFAKWRAANRIPWSRLASGALAFDDGTFR